MHLGHCRSELQRNNETLFYGTVNSEITSTKSGLPWDGAEICGLKLFQGGPEDRLVLHDPAIEKVVDRGPAS